MRFTVGSRVTWKSQAAGVWREKAVRLSPSSVPVNPGGLRWERSEFGRGRLYWPRTSALREVA